MRRLLATAALSALVLTGCGTGDDGPSGTAPSKSETDASSSAQAAPLLAEYGLDGKSTVEVIDHLDRLSPEERPDDLMASVRPGELLLSADEEEYSLDIPDDRFYLSVAPYAEQTHECFNHSLTTCMGELTGEDVKVQITDDTNDEVLVDETRTTFENGFVGFWLPRDIEGTLRISYDGMVGETKIGTGEDDPTCLTTLQLT